MLYLSDLVENSFFEPVDFLFRQCIRLGDDWHDVDSVVKRFHEFNVQWLGKKVDSSGF